MISSWSSVVDEPTLISLVYQDTGIPTRFQFYPSRELCDSTPTEPLLSSQCQGKVEVSVQDTDIPAIYYEGAENALALPQ